MTKEAHMKLPVYMPGNDRNWERVDGTLIIKEDVCELKLQRPELQAELFEMAKNNILWQVSFDYRMPIDEMEKINTQFSKEYHDEETMQKVWAGLRAAGLDDTQLIDAVNQMQNQGILFRESK